MKNVSEVLSGVHTVAILGHVRPDGDSVGSTLGMYNYIIDNFPDISPQVYLHPFTDDFAEILPGADKVVVCDEDHEGLSQEEFPVYDLCISLDVSTKDRLGVFEALFDKALATVCIDHHYTNPGFAQVNVIDGDISSASELLYSLLDEDKISERTADCLYTGIVHDTGAFCQDNTKRETMIVGGELLAKGARAEAIIQGTLKHRSFVQIKLIGAALDAATLECDGKCIISVMTTAQMEALGGRPMDLEPIINELRACDGTCCAIFMKEAYDGSWRISMRASGDFNVAEICQIFGGGGHIKASGCTMHGDEATVKKQLIDAVNNAIGQNA